MSPYVLNADITTFIGYLAGIIWTYGLNFNSFHIYGSSLKKYKKIFLRRDLSI